MSLMNELLLLKYILTCTNGDFIGISHLGGFFSGCTGSTGGGTGRTGGGRGSGGGSAGGTGGDGYSDGGSTGDITGHQDGFPLVGDMGNHIGDTENGLG